MDEAFALVRYDAARRAIAEAKTVDEAKSFRNEFKARQAYARQAKDRQLEADCMKLRFRAARRLGQIMESQKESFGTAQGRRSDLGFSATQVPKPTLDEAGIDKTLANEARTLARPDEDAFLTILEDREQHILRSDRTVIRGITIGDERQPYEGEITEGCTVEDLDALAATGYRTPVIYADPPWSFEAYSGKGKQRAADRYYDTQRLDDIAAMAPHVMALAADDCALFLWAVMPELSGALDVIRSWGFEYKTAAFVWIKTNADGSPATGMGYWTRANAEVCLLATRGSPHRIAKNVHQVVMAPRGEHSAKPEEVRHRIHRLLGRPQPPQLYLELYGRGPVPGWYVWGNQIRRTDFVRAAE
jgi:N6-adenosine-specific RNA methylase IME4